MIPQFGKFPNLVDRQNFSAFEIVSLAPFVNPFFRLEEKHRCSGEGQIIVPAGEGEGKVDEKVAPVAVLGGGDAAESIPKSLPVYFPLSMDETST